MKTVNLNLVGLDGNAFSVMAAFQRQARRENWTAQEIEYVLDEAKAGDYTHLLGTILKHCKTETPDELATIPKPDYEQTYWCGNGLYQKQAEVLQNKIPVDSKDLVAFQFAVNWYYDFYNNGGGNWGVYHDDTLKLRNYELSPEGKTALEKMLSILPTGENKVECDVCCGSGEVEEEYENTEICQFCGGEGAFDDGQCGHCYGDGEIVEWVEETFDCDSCNGDGEMSWREVDGITDNQWNHIQPILEILMNEVIKFAGGL